MNENFLIPDLKTMRRYMQRVRKLYTSVNEKTNIIIHGRAKKSLEQWHITFLTRKNYQDFLQRNGFGSAVNDNQGEQMNTVGERVGGQLQAQNSDPTDGGQK